MTVTTVSARQISQIDGVDSRNKKLQEEFERLLAGRKFIRAISLAQELRMDEQHVRPLQRSAIQQYVAEYQNFDGASRLIAEYRFTASELSALSEEILGQPELQAPRTFTMQSGQATHLSIAEQIRRFFSKEIRALLKHEQRRTWKELWQEKVTRVRSKIARARSWLTDFIDSWRDGFPGFTHKDSTRN